MSLSDQQRFARLEWLTARILLAAGLVVTVAGFFVPFSFHGLAQQNEVASLSAPAPSQSSPGATFCGTALAVAQNYGTVPAAARISSMPKKTDVQGRYVCDAADGATTFAVTVELECPNIRDQTCFSLYAVKSGDGGVLYQRQE